MHAGRVARPQHVSFAPDPPPAVAVPLSAVPPETLGVVPAEEKARTPTSHASTVASTTTGTRSKAEDLKLQFNRPQQVTGRATKYHTALAWAGRIGWCGKAVVYAMIGGLACQSAVGNDRPDPNLPTTEQVTASPQGAFVLLGATGPGIDIVILLIMLAALAAYILWRFWEGLAGQGYDETFSSRKNFFKFRLSPIVSGAVYVSYMVFLISVIDREVRNVPATEGSKKEGWPATWRYNAGGRVGLALLGIAFIIATCIQLQGVLTRQWHKDYRSDLPRKLMLVVFTIGHFGFAGRAGAFLAMAIMFFKDAGGVDTPHDSSIVANALLQLQTSRGLRAILFIVGFLLITYGLFATLSSFTRMFPTPPPSCRKRLPAAEFKQHQQQKEEGLPLHHNHSGSQQQGRGSHQASAFGRPAASPAGAGACSGSRSDLAAAPSGASNSSIPIAVDASPGWGEDQGLSNSSLDLDKQQQQQQQHTRTGMRPGSAGQVEMASAHDSRFLVLPSQRGRVPAAAAAAGAAATAEVPAGTREPPVSPRIRAALDGHRAQSREFVTIDF